MTATATLPTPAAATVAPAPLRTGYRFELVKLLAQWRVRILLAVCWLAPGLFVAAVGQQSSLPADTVFGRWMSQTGWAGPLVVLSFCCSWALPLLVSLVAGDVFASEDRLGTWRHLLVAVRAPRRIFVAKALAAITVIVWMVVGLAASAIAGGLAGVGNRFLVGLDGHLLSTGEAAGAVVLAWICVLAPTLAFAAIGLLGSVVLGRSVIGLVIPALLAVALDVVQMLPLPVVVRVALPSYGFLAWRGLFTEHKQLTPLVVGVVVSLVWAVAAIALAYLLFMRRDFTDAANDGGGRRAVLVAVAPLAAIFVASVGVVAAATPASGSGIDRARLDQSLATSFAHIYRLQTGELHRPDVTEVQLRTSAVCDKGGSLVADEGPGNDWRCVVYWHIPGARAVGSAIYQLDVTPDGRYVADGDGPVSVNGFFQVHTDSGDEPNPLWQFDGQINLITPVSKGN